MPSRVILLTGATGLIGRNLARSFLLDGHTVVATSRRQQGLTALAVEIGSASAGKLVPYEIDLLTADLEAFAEDLSRNGLAPHCLVNSARDVGNLRPGAGGRPSRVQWSAEFELGVAVPAALTWALAENGYLESVVNVAPMYGLVAVNPALYAEGETRAPIHYGVVKAALLHLTKELAVRLAPKRIRVNAVTYGGVEGETSEDFKSRYGGLTPVGHMLALEEIYPPIEFLLLSRVPSLTGHNLIVDGGWTLW